MFHQQNSASGTFTRPVGSGIKFGVLGLMGGIGISALANSKSRTWSHISLGSKMFVVSAIGLIGAILGSEYSRDTTSPGSAHYKTLPSNPEPLTISESLEKAKFKAAGIVWASTILATFGYLASQKNMKVSEKLAHGRVVAQAVTVGSIVGSLLLVGSSQKAK
eukprot:NODE_46_length_32145_cov_0.918711.p23 type:complete len:163 gc:universal NODE_46_length_32145_cov_0.918711:9546-10034(+)